MSQVGESQSLHGKAEACSVGGHARRITIGPQPGARPGLIQEDNVVSMNTPLVCPRKHPTDNGLQVNAQMNSQYSKVIGVQL